MLGQLSPIHFSGSLTYNAISSRNPEQLFGTTPDVTLYEGAYEGGWGSFYWKLIL